MSILALDLGTKCGYAILSGGERLSGTWRLADAAGIKKSAENDFDRTREPRFFELASKIEAVVKVNKEEYDSPIKLIVFEDVLFSKFTKQTQLWSSLRAAIWAVCRDHPEIRVECLNTSSLKLFGANHGGATKQMMAAWLVKRHPGQFGWNGKWVIDNSNNSMLDDNAVDANHLLDWAVKTFPHLA